MSISQVVKMASRPVTGLTHFMLEPAGLHLKAIALGGVVCAWRLEWLWCLLAVSTTISGVMIWSVLSATYTSSRHLVSKLTESSNWRRASLDLSHLDSVDWKSSFLHLGRSPLGSRSIILTPNHIGNTFLEPEAFVNPFSAGIIFMPEGYDNAPEKLSPVKRFALYHELAHNSFSGTLIWGSRHVAPISYITTIGTIILIDIPGWIFYSSSMLLLTLLLSSLSPLHRKFAAELHADSQALCWLQNDSIDDAIFVCDNRLKFWSNINDATFRQRTFNLRRWKRYLLRVREGQLAIHPPVEGHAIHSGWLEYLIALCLFFGMSSINKDTTLIANAVTIACIALLLFSLLRGHYFLRSLRKIGVVIAGLIPGEDKQ